MRQYLKKEMKYVILSLIPVIIVGVMAPLRSYMMQRIIDADGLDKALWQIVWAILFCAVVFIFEWMSKKMRLRVLNRVEKNVRLDLSQKIFELSERQFLHKGPAYFMSKFMTDIRIILDEHYNNLYEMFMQAIFLIVAIGYLLYTEPIMLGVIILVSVIQFFVPQKIKGTVMDRKSQYTKEMERYVKKVDDMLKGEKVIRTFGAQKDFIGSVQEANDALCDKNAASTKVLYWGQALLSFIGNLSFVIILGGSMLLVALGNITMGQLVAITNMTNFILTPCKVLANGYIQIKSVKKIEKELEDVLALKSEKEAKISWNADITKIEFVKAGQKLSDSFALEDISVSFEKGKKYAIVGESGSGKSSLLKMLTEYGEGYTGNIRLNGVELRDIERESVLAKIPITYQNTFLFEDTLFQNIALYQGYTKEQAIKALREAGLNDGVNDTLSGVEEKWGGEDKIFSGGEVQRIGLARAFLRNPQILLLDEVTANLDSIVALEVEERLLNDPDRTILYVTHRYTPSIMKRFDQIIVMKKGRIVETGSYDELMEKEEFRNLYWSAHAKA